MTLNEKQYTVFIQKSYIVISQKNTTFVKRLKPKEERLSEGSNNSQLLKNFNGNVFKDAKFVDILHP